ncbi:hypothetical protein KAFR_0C00150 [Kazachstania africana CBS 2517]|uniref:NAD-dependent epimerase/dehydratase domain-containing protein n=1 Tax=Kazachstania africana (strain ATCC 22294 / BCRC 22015 / CBS 2517 / CECT 1963 / NBRC 1671 / NRRL Y-8276) TaxID=1071382 RepID=H2ARL1_KAZAF|nr:hypothetical protein KAFR_0C00150 [Kazachstania africana CBS 2517]CCF57011.1 hypothetical protein KAFR_0C00150 [Kazachstania africana CBS 2517]
MSVFVSGATGFIAQHIIGQLLEQNYKVIGTARSQAKIDKLLKQFGNKPGFTMEIVNDISELEAFDAVFKKHGKDVKYVLHTASPFHFESTNIEKDLLLPAVNGTKGILESIKKYAADSVERVVITSSYAAIMDFKVENDVNTVRTEADWNPDTWESCQANAHTGYCGSKKFAEKTAWEFLEANKNEVKFKLATVNPVFVFGPQYFDEDVSTKLNTSCEYVNQLVHAKADDPILPVCGGFIDVRDVAKAHILAMQKEELIGQRLLMTGGKFNFQDIVDILNEDFPALQGNIPVGKPHTGAQHKQIGAKVDNSKTKSLLGFEFRTLKEVIDDTAAQILKHEGKL